MFTFISWQQYLLAIIALITLYYSGILLVYYRVEIATIFNWKMTRQIKFEPTNLNSNSVLGEIKQNDQEASLSSEELEFSSETQSQIAKRNQ